MVSLETLTPFQDIPIELEQFWLIPSSDVMALKFIRHFEWVFGLECSTFSYESELNTISVSKDIRRYLKERALVLLPNTEVLEKAYGMLVYNDASTREPSERMRFEDFGVGPWEYTILPRCWNRSSWLSEPLPPLFHLSSDGSLHPVRFDSYDTLPRFTSTIHPLIAILCHRVMFPDDCPIPEIQEKLIEPVQKICLAWPLELHNRFVPLPNQNFKNPVDNMKAKNTVCRCCVCFREESTTSDESAASDGSDIESGYTSTATSEEEIEDAEARILEYKEISRTTNERISRWRTYLEKVPFCREDVYRDDILDEYTQEPAEDAEKVTLSHLKEEEKKREALAEGLHQELASRKRSRRR